MGWKILVFVSFVQLVYVSASVPQMSLVREWESVDLLVPGEGGQETSRRPLDQFSDIYSIIMDYWLLDVYKDRLFVAFRLTRAPFSLAYHNLSDTSKSLLLQPYPSWDAHSDEHGDRQIQEVVAFRADRCDRIWVIDRDKSSDDTPHNVIVFDLNSDRILRKHTFRHSIDFYYHVAVDDDDCENPYLYISDYGQGGIWTYSWAEDTMWHHPGDIVTGIVIEPNKSDYSIVYYNKKDMVGVLYISTRYLRDKTSNYLSEFEHRGGHYVSLDSTTLDAKSNVLFIKSFDKFIQTMPCWNIYERCDPSGWQDIAVNTTHRVSHIILDKNDNLWAFTHRPTFRDNQINLSIFSAAIISANVEVKENNTINTTNDTASPATDPATNTTVQASGADYDRITNTTVTIEDTITVTPNSDITDTMPVSSSTEHTSGIDYDGSSNTTVTIEDITGGMPNSDITATDPASSTIKQASNVGYDGISNTTVTIEDITWGTPNSNITATDPTSSTTEQASGVDNDDISNTTVTIEETPAVAPNSTITATDPASSMTEQASGVDYDGISNTTVTIEDITGGTPNSNITATDPASSTTEQASGVDYDDISNTTVTIEETPAVTPNSTITATDPASSMTEQASGVDYDGISNTTVTIEDITRGTPNSNITATDPASSTTEQAPGVDYDGISNITVTIEDITGGTPNSTITATDPATSTTEQASGVDYDGISYIHYWDYWRYYMQWGRQEATSPQAIGGNKMT